MTETRHVGLVSVDLGREVPGTRSELAIRGVPALGRSASYWIGMVGLIAVFRVKPGRKLELQLSPGDDLIVQASLDKGIILLRAYGFFKRS